MIVVQSEMMQHRRWPNQPLHRTGCQAAPGDRHR
jgi:hypothetical protein